MKSWMSKPLLSLLCFLLVTLSFVGIPQGGAHAQSIAHEVANAGFEEAVAEGVIPGWTQIMGTAEGGSITVDSTQKNNGNYSLKMYDNAADNYAVESDKVAVVAGEQYTVTASVYIGVAVQLQLRFYDNSDKLIIPIAVHNTDFQAAPKNIWESISLDATSPDGAVKASIVLVTAKSGKGTSYWDDIVFASVTSTEPEPTPTPEPSVEPTPVVPVYSIANSSFESSAQEGKIPNWTIKSGIPTISTEQAKVGGSSLKAQLVANEGQAAINIESDLIDVAENTTYVFSAQTYLELGSIQGFYIYVYDKDGKIVKSADNKDFHVYKAVTKPNEKWEYSEQAFTVQPGGVKLKVSLITGAKNSFTFYVDEVSILKQVINGDMEEPVVNGIIPGWSKTKPADASSFTITNDRKDSGDQSLHIASTQGEFINVISDLIPVEAGATYSLAARTWIENGSADMYVRFFDADGAYMGKQFWNITAEPAGVWFDQYVTAIAPEGAQFAAILFAGSNKKNYSFYVDNIKLMRGEHDIPEVSIPENSITVVGENLGPQIRKATLMRGAIGLDANNRQVIYTVVAGAPSIFTIIDIETEQVVKSMPMPDTSGAWSVTMSADGSVYMGAYNLGLLYRYIPSTDALVNLGHPFASKDSVLYPMAAGKDGIMYGSTYPTAHLYAYNPATNGFTDYGTLSTKNSGERWTRVTVYDEVSHKIYAGVGNVPRLVEFDLATGTKRDLLPAGFENIVSVYDLNIADGRLFARKEANNANETFVIDIASGELVEVTNADTGEKSTTFINFSRGVSPVSPIANKLYFAGMGGLLYEYDLDTNSYRSTDVSIEGAAIAYEYLELNEFDFPGFSLVGLSGNSGKMFKYNLETGAVKLTDIQVPAEPVNIHEIIKGPDGKIYSAGYLQGNLGVYTPTNGNSIYYEGIGQGEAMTVIHNKLYFGIYPGATIYEYDLSKPWNRTNSDQLNPNRLFTLADINQDRPFGLAGAEDLNKLFVGTVPKNGMLGGALAVYDIEVGGTPEVYDNLITDQSILSLAYQDGLLYGGTSIHGGQGGTPTKSEAMLFIWDVANKEKIFEVVPVVGKQAITALHFGPDGNLWGLANGALFVFDIETRQVTYSNNAFPNANGRWIDGSMEIGTDGNVYATVGGNFFKVDAKTKEITVLATGVRKLAQDDFGSFYMYTDPETPILYKYTMDALLLKLTGVEMSIQADELAVGEKTTVELLGLLDKERETKELSGATKVYISTDSSIAEVDSNGVVTAKSAGTTQLTVQVTLDGVTVESNSISLTVNGLVIVDPDEPRTPSIPGGSHSETILVEVKLENSTGIVEGVSLGLTRTRGADGSITDQLQLDTKAAQQIVGGLINSKSRIVEIRLPDSQDEVDATTVVIVAKALAILGESGIDIILSNDHVSITMASDSMRDQSKDVSFRIVSVQNDKEKTAIEDRANNDASIASVTGNNPIDVIGLPISIVTSLQGQPITLVLPLDSRSFSDAELKELAVYIEHSDGSKELVNGEIIEMNESDKLGIRITIDRFSTFAVVKVNGWNDIIKANNTKYIHGYDDGSFRPDQLVKRVEVAAMIARLIENKLTNYGNNFRDIPNNHWGLPSVKLMVQLDLMKGYGDGNFKPDQAITRVEMAMILLPLIENEKVEKTSTTFSDMNGHWASDAVTQLYLNGIVQGYGDGTFRPNSLLTRAEAVAMINRAYGIIPVKDVQPSWKDVNIDHWAFGTIQAVSE